MAGAFAHGFLLALALILPLGPQNSFVLQQGAMHRRYSRVIWVVVLASLSDSALIILSVAGVGLVIVAMPTLKWALIALGVLFLIWMGLQSWRQTPGGVINDWAGQSDWPQKRQIAYTLIVSLLNPHALMDTLVVIGSGAAFYTQGSTKIAYTAAAIIVSWLWFWALSWAGRATQGLGRSVAVHHIINRASAIIMWAVAMRYLMELVSLAVVKT